MKIAIDSFNSSTAVGQGTPFLPREVRRIVLEQSRRAGVGHIGSALSVADIVALLFGKVMHIESPDDPDRDRFVLSKGHAALAVYAALRLRGWLDDADLATYCGDGSLLGVHPEAALLGVDFCTGSLGQGMSLATGAALAARLHGSTRRVFALLSDAECNEGSTWEAVMFASHHQMSNLVAFVDLNGQQALGYTRDVLDLSDMANRWCAFGWDVHEVDGHNVDQMTEVLNTLDLASGPPHVLIARTTFGKGVSYMESEIKWHYLPMSEDEFTRAMSELGAGQ